MRSRLLRASAVLAVGMSLAGMAAPVAAVEYYEQPPFEIVLLYGCRGNATACEVDGDAFFRYEDPDRDGCGTYILGLLEPQQIQTLDAQPRPACIDHEASLLTALGFIRIRGPSIDLAGRAHQPATAAANADAAVAVITDVDGAVDGAFAHDWVGVGAGAGAAASDAGGIVQQAPLEVPNLGALVWELRRQLAVPTP